jgi:succinate dehydrogenase / fumarate reductase cytochrome b subunit
MSSAPTPRHGQPPRPKYYDLSLAHLPPPGLVSIFHRISGLLLFFPILPLLLYVLQATLGSEEGYARWHDLVADRPAVKLIFLAFTWAYAHHFFAGIRYLLLDVHWGIAKAPARASAVAVLVLGVLATLIVAWRIW